MAHLFPFSALCVEVHVPSSLLSLQATSNLPLPFLFLVKLTPSCSFTLFVFLSFFTSHSMSSINKIFYLLLYLSLTFSLFFASSFVFQCLSVRPCLCFVSGSMGTRRATNYCGSAMRHSTVSSIFV